MSVSGSLRRLCCVSRASVLHSNAAMVSARAYCSAGMSKEEMRKATIDLYKEFLFVGRDYPGGVSEVREKAKPQFMSMKEEEDMEKLEKGLAKGQYILSELVALNRFHKYRALRKQYYDADSLRAQEEHLFSFLK